MKRATIKDMMGALSGAFGTAANDAGDSIDAVAAAKAVAQQRPARKPEPEAEPKPVYVSLRVTPDEKARLKRDAAGMSLSAYVRERLLGSDVKPRKTRGKFPVKDHAALAKVLRALGQSNLARDFEALNWALQDGTVHLDPDSTRVFRQACRDVSAMHDALMVALGRQAGRAP